MTDTMSRSVEAIVSSLERILVRRFRESLYRQVGHASSVTIRDGTYPVLSGLRHGPLTATELSKRIGVDRTVISRQASELTTLGLVTRGPDPRDKRGGLLTLTPDGQAAADRLGKAFAQLVKSATHDWPDVDRARFADRLNAFIAAVLDAEPS